MKSVVFSDITELIAFPNDLVFFLPKTTRPRNLPRVEHPRIKRFWHTGVVFQGKVYETFNFEKFSIGELPFRGKELLSQRAVFCEVHILDERLENELKSGTSCDEFVLRVPGHSQRTGNDKGDQCPDDVYKLICSA